MTSTELKAIAPLETTLPALPDGEVLTGPQWATLLAIADTIIPPIVASSQAPADTISLEPGSYEHAVQNLAKTIPRKDASDIAGKFLAEKASTVPGFKEAIHRTLATTLRSDAAKGLRVVLSALNTRLGCLVATGSTTPFHLQSAGVREQILQGWFRSYLPVLRDTASAFTKLVSLTWLRHSPTLGLVLGFPRAPVHGKPGKGFPYDFIYIPPGEQPEVLEADVVIVGSGCGGGVCAKNLAESGQRVVVVDKGYHWAPEYLPMTEKDAGSFLFANGGAEASDDSSIAVVSGSVWGGGGTVNWSASLQTQGFVRKEWADSGLPIFTTPAFQSSLDRVCDFMGVSTKHVEHNVNNQMLVEGARRLGYRHRDVPQNTGGNKHYCGYCSLGCGAAEKQGPVVSFLPAAAKAGARFMEGFDVERVLFDESTGKKVTTGIRGLWQSRDSNGGISGEDRYTRSVIINAKRVVVSAGTLNSPLVLLRSGLSNPNIGRNLHLHPATTVTAFYPERPDPINPWEGGILTTVVDEFDNLDGHGHGVKLECMVMLPSFALPVQKWQSGLQYKSLCAKFPYVGSHLVIVRDRDTGRIYPDPVDGKTRIAYTPSAFDRAHGVQGVEALARIAYVNGAAEIMTCSSSIPNFTRPSSPAEADVAFDTWLKTIRTTGLAAKDVYWGSAHQMSSCRMSASPSTGVVDPTGRVWEAEGLYVADASVMPSASGVNPMVTNMALSDAISRGIAGDMKSKGSTDIQVAEERPRL